MPLTVAEVRRLVLALAAPEAHRPVHLAWSLWRRTHQAVAARCQSARHARDREHRVPTAPRAPVQPPAASTTSTAAVLTATEWEAVCALLPPQRPPVGRPRHDHRTVLGGIVWVLRNQASWRSLPPTFGKWETAYKRYRLWQATGLWQQPATALALGATPSLGEVSL